jgi:hypothetical protein
MTQQEFEGWTHTTVDPEDYKIIETVYQGYDGMTKMTAATLFMECGLRPFVVLALDVLQGEYRQLAEEHTALGKQLEELDETMDRWAEKINRKEAT